jgi:hypothetical protein
MTTDHKQRSKPYKISSTLTRKQVLKKYEHYIRKKIEEEDLWDDLEALRGKTLGCWCHPEACHGDILLKLLRETKKSKN